MSHQFDSPESMTYFELLQEGRNSSKSQINKLIDLVREDPSNLQLRLKILGYLEPKQGGSNAQVTSLFRDHMLWLVREHPESSSHQWIFLRPNATEFRAIKRVAKTGPDELWQY